VSGEQWLLVRQWTRQTDSEDTHEERTSQLCWKGQSEEIVAGQQQRAKEKVFGQRSRLIQLGSREHLPDRTFQVEAGKWQQHWRSSSGRVEVQVAGRQQEQHLGEARISGT